MKAQYFLVLTLALLTTKLKAQFTNYNFELRYDTFSPLVNATTVLSDTLWLSDSYANSGFDLSASPFLFPFQNEHINTLFFTPSSVPKTFGAGFDLYGDSFFVYMKIGGFAIREFADTPPYTSKVSYLIDSSNALERFFKLELLNVGVADSNNNTVGKINLQIWLSSKGRVEFHYGQCNVPDYAYYYKRKVSHLSGINNYNYKWGQSPRHAIYAVGNPYNPNVYKLDSLPEFGLFADSTLTVYPSNVVHAFYIGSVGIKQVNKNADIALYPNPVVSTLTIQSGSKINTITVWDICGNQLLQVTNSLSTKTELTLNLSTIKSGFYIIKMETDDGIILKKIIKSDD